MPLLSLSQCCIHATLISDCLTKKRGGSHQRTAKWHIRVDRRCGLLPLHIGKTSSY